MFPYAARGTMRSRRACGHAHTKEGFRGSEGALIWTQIEASVEITRAQEDTPAACARAEWDATLLGHYLDLQNAIADFVNIHKIHDSV
eukprot:3552015-Pyramimonas_sp.AAC.1